MDQLRAALDWLKRYHFWVLCVVVSLIAIGCWWKASGKMQATYNTREATIKKEFTSVDSLGKDPFHPNQDVNDKQAAETETQRKSVASIWQQIFDRQHEHVLKWPVPPLIPEFGTTVEKLSFGADIPLNLRSNYQNYIVNHYPELPKKVGARPLLANAAGAVAGVHGGPELGIGPAAPGGVEDENDYICQWLDTDQGVIREELNFPQQQPYSVQIWVTQEDLWVYETMLDVIANTNKAAHASRMSNAAVKVIAELSVGQRAAKFSRTSGRLEVPPAAAGGSAPGPEGAGPTGRGGAGPEGGVGQRMDVMPDRGGVNGQMSEEQERLVLLSGRYLDPAGKPIPFGGGSAPADPNAPVQSSPAPGLDLSAFGKEYKQLPVRMILHMNQRWLPYLISQCASQPLQIEVQEVRINVADASALGTGTGPGGGGSFRGSPGGGSGGGNLFPEETGVSAFTSHPEMVNVIIQGTIYIFNKPNLPAETPPSA